MIPRKDTKAGAKEVSKVIEESKGRPQGQGLGRLQGNAPRLRKSPREDPKVLSKDDSKERPQGRGKGSLQGQRRVQGKTSRSRPRKTPRKCPKAK